MNATANGFHRTDEQDWAAWLDYAADQQRFPRDERTPCQNPDCSALCASLFCSEDCREQAEGPDHDDDVENEEHPPTVETSSSDRRNLGHPEGKNGVSAFSLPEAPASANVFVTLKGRQVQLTLRDTDETRLLHRLSVVLEQFPLETTTQASTPPAPSPTPTCKWHGTMKESTKAKGTWYCPAKMGDGSYCKERHHG
jgi:hypothetical protein